MPTFRAARITHQGKDIIIVPLEGDFPSAPMRIKRRVHQDLQAAAIAAGFTGVVVPAWSIDPDETLLFLAPDEWREFLQDFNIYTVARLWEDELIID
jgi:hypothetical protein